MAEQKDASGLSAAVDYSKLPLFGATESQLKTLRDAQTEALSSLEQRYAQPNWFNIAAGFAKPQLGGFTASLGSAAGAYGEQQEKQRDIQVPIAEMKAKIAQSNYVLGANTGINEEIKKWMEGHQGQTPPASLIMEWRAKAPSNPTVQSLFEQQKTTMDQQAQQIQTANGLYASGQITKEEFGRRLRAIEASQSPQGIVPNAVGKPVTAEPKPSDATINYNDSHIANIVAIKREIAIQEQSGINKEGVEKLKDLLKNEEAALEKTSSSTTDEKIPDSRMPSYEKLGATGESSIRLTEAQLDAMNKRYAPLADSIAYFDPQKTDDTYNRISRLSELLNTEGVKKGTGLLYQDQGVVAALKQMINQGFSLSGNAAGTGANFNVSLPVESTNTKLKLSPTEQADLREFQSLLSLEGRNDLSAATRAIGGGHMNMSEFQNAMGGVMTSSDPYNVLAKFLSVRALENERNAKLFDAFGEYQTGTKTAGLPTSYFFHLKDSPYKTLMDDYKKKIKNARANQ